MNSSPTLGRPASSDVFADIAHWHDVLLLVAHPDDDVIGAGGHLPLWKNVSVLYVTDGAPRDMTDANNAGYSTREAYAAERYKEAQSALRVANIPECHIATLGIVDQEASLALVELTHSIAGWIEKIAPSLVITHSYEGGHPDHDAVAFAVHSAFGILDQASCPELIEMTSYHQQSGAMRAGDFIELAGTPLPEVSIVLDASQSAWKTQMFSCHQTQRGVLQYFPIHTERFRCAPDYDFAVPPPGEGIYYEQFRWGMNSEKWCGLAQKALRELE